MKEKQIILVIVLISVFFGIFTKDILGTLILLCALLNSYYSSIGKVINYVFGINYCLLSMYVGFINGLYGLAFFTAIVYLPLQIHGFYMWNKHKISSKENEVPIKSFNLKKSILLLTFCVILSLGLSGLLNIIPGQKLSFLDASSNISDLCAVILMNNRYRECWMVWIFNNVIDVVIWIINMINHSPNAIMMFISSLGFLFFNIYGLIKWNEFKKLEGNGK